MRLKEKKKTQFRERMLKRYTSEEIRRAFGVAATDKRSDEELLDSIYSTGVASSWFMIILLLFAMVLGKDIANDIGTTMYEWFVQPYIKKKACPKFIIVL